MRILPLSSFFSGLPVTIFFLTHTIAEINRANHVFPTKAGCISFICKADWKCRSRKSRLDDLGRKDAPGLEWRQMIRLSPFSIRRLIIFETGRVPCPTAIDIFMTPFYFSESQVADCPASANFLRRRCVCIFFHSDKNVGARLQGKIRQKKDTVPTVVCCFRPVKSIRIETGTSHRCFIITSCAGSLFAVALHFLPSEYFFTCKLKLGANLLRNVRNCLLLLIFFDYYQTWI
jgi:hypothetical protein